MQRNYLKYFSVNLLLISTGKSKPANINENINNWKSEEVSHHPISQRIPARPLWPIIQPNAWK